MTEKLGVQNVDQDQGESEQRTETKDELRKKIVEYLIASYEKSGRPLPLRVAHLAVKHSINITSIPVEATNTAQALEMSANYGALS